jgi:hypothetical protein
MSTAHGPTSPLTFSLGSEEVVIRRRYRFLSVVNDILIGLWFTVGSVLFFSESTSTAGTWLFLVGSIELLIRPGIRLTRSVDLRRRARGRGEAASAEDPEGDF